MADHHNHTSAGIQSLLRLVRDVARTSGTGFTGSFKKDCTDLSRRVALLSHILEEIRDFEGDSRPSASSSSSNCSLSELTAALKAAKSLVLSAGSFDHNTSPDGAAQKSAFQFQCVTWKLEKALASLPYDLLNISEEVKEQVDLVRGQLKRASERYGGSQDMISLSYGLSSESLAKESDSIQTVNIDLHEVESKVGDIQSETLSEDQDEIVYQPTTASSVESSLSKPTDAVNVTEENNSIIQTTK